MPRHESFSRAGITISSVAPTAVNGATWVNTADGILYIYWGSWQSTGITLIAPAVTPRFASLWFLMPNLST